jgi:carbonic anhydrase
MDDIDALLENNRAWAQRMVAADSRYFERLATQQTPRYLWIGCSDSRVPANQILGLAPGEVFVHRNVANLVVHTDLNCLPVVQFAVDELKVGHIMIVGHYGCGGVHAVLGGRSLGLADHWLRHVEDVRQVHRRRLQLVSEDSERVDRLCELNVIEQVCHVAQLPTVRAAWERCQPLAVHGMIYGLRDGILRHLGARVSAPVDLREWRRQALLRLWLTPPGEYRPASHSAQDGGSVPVQHAR